MFKVKLGLIRKELVVTHSNSQIKVPYYEIGNGNKGPHLVLSGGMHGDEINGVLMIDHFLDWVDKNGIEKEIEGKITVIPIMNPSGFQRMERYVPEDSKDLNRCFMVDQPTTISEMLAEELIKKIYSSCHFAIDFHDAGQKSVLLPHARVHKGDENKTLLLAQVFGTKIIVERDGKDNMLAVALKNRFGIPVITVEIGGGSKKASNFIIEGMIGVRNILKYFGMFDGKIVIPDKQYYLNQRYGMYAERAAYVELDVDLGDYVHFNQKLGTLYYPGVRKTMEIKAPMCGLLFNKTPNFQLALDDLIFSILETKECHVKITTSGNFEELPEVKVKKIKM